jgi:hypothetical protein
VLKRFAARWDAFFFAPQTGYALAAFRIAWGALIVYRFALLAPFAVELFSDAGVFRAETLAENTPRARHSLLFWLGSPGGVTLALVALLASAASLAAGLFTRASAVATLVLVVSFHERNEFALGHVDALLRLMLVFLALSPAGAAWSVDRLLARRSAPGEGPRLVRPWAQRMMQIQLALVYLLTVRAKLQGQLWPGGAALYYVFGLTDYVKPGLGLERLMDAPFVYRPLTYAVVATELALPFALWSRKARPYAALAGVLLHGAIALTMSIPVFGLAMVCCYLPFFDEAEVRAAARRLAAPGRAVAILLKTKLWRPRTISCDTPTPRAP